MTRQTLVALLLVSLSACANGYEEFYQPLPNAYAARPTPGVEPRVLTSTGDPSKDARAMFERGYWAIGYANFNGPVQNIQGAIAEARKVGAGYVVVSAKYAYTVSGAMPVTVPEPQTSYSSGSVSVSGDVGSASGTYSGTTTTYGSSTTWVPYSIPRYDQSAVYFAPLPRTGLGVEFRPPTDAEARAHDTSHIRVVLAVRRESPAYKADILPGDILTAVNGSLPQDDVSLRAALSGQVRLTLDRDGRSLEKAVDVPPEW